MSSISSTSVWFPFDFFGHFSRFSPKFFPLLIHEKSKISSGYSLNQGNSDVSKFDSVFRQRFRGKCEGSEEKIKAGSSKPTQNSLSWFSVANRGMLTVNCFFVFLFCFFDTSNIQLNRKHSWELLEWRLIGLLR